MPREMGELRRLCVEWNSLVDLARARGLRNSEGRLYRYRRQFHMLRDEARQRVADLRAQLAPFFAPISDEVSPAALLAANSETFGVELECMMGQGYSGDSGREQVALAIRSAGVLCMAERYNHITRDHWKITTDRSLGHDVYRSKGAEIVSPVLRGEEGLESIRKVCNILTELKCRVNTKCGLHVHVGAAARRGVPFLKNMARMYQHFDGVIDAFMSPSRRGPSGGGGFCGSLRVDHPRLEIAQTVQDVGRAIGQNFANGNRSPQRYRKFNILTYFDPGTVEFRHHQGTVDAQKTEMWVKLCLRMTARADVDCSALPGIPQTFDSFMSFIDASAVEAMFFRERMDFFARAEGRIAA
jgi:hypothetical protein